MLFESFDQCRYERVKYEAQKLFTSRMRKLKISAPSSVCAVKQLSHVNDERIYVHSMLHWVPLHNLPHGVFKRLQIELHEYVRSISPWCRAILSQINSFFKLMVN